MKKLVAELDWIVRKKIKKRMALDIVSVALNKQGPDSQDGWRELSLENEPERSAYSDWGGMAYLKSRPMSLSVPLHPVLDFQRQYAMVPVTITSATISTVNCMMRTALDKTMGDLPRQ